MSDLNKESAEQAPQQRGYSATYVCVVALLAMMLGGFVVHLVNESKTPTVCIVHEYAAPSGGHGHGSQNPTPTTNRPSERERLYGPLAGHADIPVFVGADSTVFGEFRLYVVNNTYGELNDNEINRIAANLTAALEAQEGRSLDQVPAGYQATLWPRPQKSSSYVPDSHAQQLPAQGAPQLQAPETHVPPQPPSTPQIGGGMNNNIGVGEAIHDHC